MSSEDEAGLGFKAAHALSSGSSSPPPYESCAESKEQLDLDPRRQQQKRDEEDMEQGVLDGKACDGTSEAQEMILASAAAATLGEKVCQSPQSLSGSESESTCSTDPSPTPICRICFQGLEQGSMLNPCRCDGSVRYTHQPCLLKWISERGSWNCELCCYRYQVTAIKMKQPSQWQGITVTLVEKVQIIAVMLGSLFLIASITWLLWSAFSPNAVWQRKDVLFQICYGMYGFMDFVCLGLIIHERAAVCKVFKRWRAVNLHWIVVNYNKTIDVEESSSNEESSASRTLWSPLNTLRSSSLGHTAQTSTRSLHCGYTLLHLFHHMRRHNDSVEDDRSGEMVMRVTSV